MSAGSGAESKNRVSTIATGPGCRQPQSQELFRRVATPAFARRRLATSLRPEAARKLHWQPDSKPAASTAEQKAAPGKSAKEVENIRASLRQCAVAADRP